MVFGVRIPVHRPGISPNYYLELEMYIIHRNINLIGELSSRAHFKGNFILIKNKIGNKVARVL